METLSSFYYLTKVNKYNLQKKKIEKYVRQENKIDFYIKL